MLRLCHLSDPHVSRSRPGSLEMLESLLRRALALGTDHVVLTGDVLDEPDREDLRRVIDLLARLGLWRPDRLTLLPGNHDLDRPGSGRSPAERGAHLRRFLRETAEVNRPLGASGGTLAPGRPVLKRLGPVDLVAVCTASTHHDIEGRVTEDDVVGVRRLLAGAGSRVALVAVHQHPDPLPVGRHPVLGRFVPEGLQRGVRLLDACAEAGVHAILHGHIHTAGGRFDRSWRGVRLRTQGTAKGEKRDAGARRYGFDRYLVTGRTVVRRPWHRVLPAEQAVPDAPG